MAGPLRCKEKRIDMSCIQNGNKISQTSKDFSTSLSLIFYDSESLIAAQEKRGRERLLPHLIAELYVRYCFAHDSQISDYLKQVLDEPLSSRLFDESLNFPWGKPRFATDLDFGESRKIKTAIDERWELYSQADGAFPVCSEDDAFLLPFLLTPHAGEDPWAVDYVGNKIPEWDEAVACMKGDYQVKVMLPSDHPQLTGHSLQLPVFLSILVKDGKFPPFDPFRFIITGALDAGRLSPVLVMTKYKVLQKKYPDAVFACPRPQEDCRDEFGDNVEIMPIGLSLPEIRNFCSEAVHFHHLLKGESRDGQLPGKDFFGRDDELRKIHQLLNPDNGRNKKIPLLLGASGIGKTGLALQYGKISHPFEYPLECVLLDAGTSYTSLLDIFAVFIDSPYYQRRYGFRVHPEIQKPDEKFKALVYQFAQKKQRILFILDNLNPGIVLNADVEKYFSEYQHSVVDFIATATLCDFKTTPDDLIEIIRIDGLSEKDGIGLLNHKHAVTNLEEKQAANEIVHFLDGNAWALDVVGEDVKQMSGSYRAKLEELKKHPLQAVTPNSPMARIAHGEVIDPCVLFQPVLERLDKKELLLAQAAACCDPEYIFPKWLDEFYEQKVKTVDVTSLSETPINQLVKAHILLRGQVFLSMHRLTHAVIIKKYKYECVEHRRFLEQLLTARNQQYDVSEMVAYAKFMRYRLSDPRSKHQGTNINDSPRPKADVIDIISRNIPISYHPLEKEFSNRLEKETYLYSFAVVFAATESPAEKQIQYLNAISELFHCSFRRTVLSTLIHDATRIDWEDIKLLLATEKRQNAWLADAVFLLNQAPQTQHERLKEIIVQFMKIFNRNVGQISELIENYLVISTESAPSTLWEKIKTMPGNYSWKSILDFRKIGFNKLWDPLICKLYTTELICKNFEIDHRLYDNLAQYDMPHVTPVLDFITKCKIIRWMMTSDMNSLKDNFFEFWHHYSDICRKANNILYVFGEKEVDFPTFEIKFDDDYSAINQDRWYASLKKAYAQYKNFSSVVDQKSEILRRQLKLYQQGKLTISAVQLIAEEQLELERKKQQHEDEKRIFEFTRAGKKFQFETECSETVNIPFDYILTATYFCDSWFILSSGSLWYSKDCVQWKKIDQFPAARCNNLVVINDILFAWETPWVTQFYFSRNGFNWNTGRLSCKVERINTFFHFNDMWWISVNVYHDFSYVKEVFFLNSEEKCSSGRKTVFFTSNNLSGDWKQSLDFSLSDGQIISSNSLLATEDRIFAIRSWDYCYHDNKHIPDSAVFVFSNDNKQWVEASCSHELTRWDEPAAETCGLFLPTDRGFFCATDKGLFVSDKGNSWKKIEGWEPFSSPKTFATIDDLLFLVDDYNLYIYHDTCGLRVFTPQFQFDELFINDNNFIAMDRRNKKIFHGKFRIKSQ